MGRKRVVVIGAGFGGLAVAKGLSDQAVDVIVIDANNFHTFQPLLYQVATAGLNADDIGYPIRGIFKRQRNVTVRMGRVIGADFEQRLALIEDGADEPYDYLVVAAGAVTNSFGVPGVDEHAFSLKSIDEAMDLRAHILDRFESTASDPSLIDHGSLNVVVCGAGPTGVELSGALMELFTKVLAGDFPALDVRRARVILVEATDRPLAAFQTESSERARRTLTKQGVEVMTGVGVDHVDANSVHLVDGTVLLAHTIVWTAGVMASPLARTLGLRSASGGRIVVDSDLRITGYSNVFAIGDIAASPGPAEDSVLPQVAQPAIQGGRHVAKQISQLLAGKPTEPFRYHDKGTMATIGRHVAVTEFPNGRRLSGFIGWLAWLGLHLLYLVGFRNRANVLVDWAWNYFTYDRGSRLLSDARRRAVMRD